MSWKAMAAEHLTAELLDQRRPTTYTIVAAERKRLQKLDGNGQRPRAVLSFEETDLTFPLNATNLLCVQAIWPNDRDAIGKQIHLYVVDEKLGKEPVKAIRIWGSPSLPADRTITIQPNKRKRALQVTLHRLATPAGAGRASASAPAASPPAPYNPLPESDFLDLQRRINECGDPALLEDLKAEAKSVWRRLDPEHHAVITLAIQQAGERPGMTPP